MVASPVVGSLCASVKGMMLSPLVIGTAIADRAATVRSPSTKLGVGMVTVHAPAPVFSTTRNVPVPVGEVSPLAGAAAAPISARNASPLSGQTLTAYWAITFSSQMPCDVHEIVNRNCATLVAVPSGPLGYS